MCIRILYINCHENIKNSYLKFKSKIKMQNALKHFINHHNFQFQHYSQ